MIINLAVGKELKNTGCIITEVYPNLVKCKTPEGRSMCFNVGDYISNNFETREVWEQEDDYFLNRDFGAPVRL